MELENKNKLKNLEIQTVPHLKIAYFNARSIRNKYNELRHFIKSNSYDVIFICETWLTADDTLNLETVDVVRSDRIGAPGGGVCVIVKPSVQYRIISISSLQMIEYLILEISDKKGRSVRFGLYYIPPGLTDWEIKLGVIRDSFAFFADVQEAVVVGDFNSGDID